MITRLTRAAPIALVTLLFAGAAYAQTSTPAKTDTAPAATPAPTKKATQPRSAQSMECSKEADAKGLHGKERKKFRSECKKQPSDPSKT